MPLGCSRASLGCPWHPMAVHKAPGVDFRQHVAILFCALVRAVNCSVFLFARRSVLLIIRDIFCAPIFLNNWSGYFLARRSVLLIIRGIFCVLVYAVNYSRYFLRAGLCC